MRASVRNYIDACKRRKEETGESGFSLIELIIVVVILGILVAIALPIFGSIQDRAAQNAVEAAAANGATAVATKLADPAGSPSTTDEIATSAGTPGKMTVTLAGGASKNTTVSNVCVKAVDVSATPKTALAGPGCAGVTP